MLSFKTRSYEKELMDNLDIPFKDISKNLDELEFINKYLGGHKITINGIKYLSRKGKTNLSILEVGSGGGDNLIAVKNYLKRKGIKSTRYGLDVNKTMIEYMTTKDEEILPIHQNYKGAVLDDKVDIIFCSLLCHHLHEDEILELILWMKDNSRLGFFINDLERNKLPYYLIKILSGLFSKSYLLKHDAPLSVARSLTKSEWLQLLNKANIKNFRIQRKWAFRFLITFTN